MQKLILLGGGGHCRSCIDVIEQEGSYAIAGILDAAESIGQKVLGYDIVGTDDDVGKFVAEGCAFLITVGQIKSASIRRKLAAVLAENDAPMATVVSPRAYVSKHADIAKGTIVMHDALINAAARVGENCIINTKALIEHDAVIEEFCHISTSATVNGRTTVKAGTFFGSNAVSKECTVTGQNDFIKAGSVCKGVL